MKIFDKIRNFLITLDDNTFKKYVLIFLAVLFCILSFIFYRYFARISYLRKENQRINVSRQEAQQILTKHQQVKVQKNLVSEMLENGKNFKLMEFFDSLVEKLNLSNKVREKRIAINELDNSATKEYEEITLEVQLGNINMKELTDLLNEIEGTERVYIKGLEITRPNMNPSVDVNINIATLQLKAE